jgi:hypothetical protein
MFQIFPTKCEEWKAMVGGIFVSSEEFCKHLNTSTAFIVVDVNTNEQLGLHCFRGNKNIDGSPIFTLLLHLKHRGRILPRRCWSMRRSSSGRMGIVLSGIIAHRTIILQIMCSVSNWYPLSSRDRVRTFLPPE